MGKNVQGRNINYEDRQVQKVYFEQFSIKMTFHHEHEPSKSLQVDKF